MPDNWVGTLTGPALHLIFLASVFDIHFKSPVLRLPDPAAPSYPAPASRLVLFVADGLRGQSFYEAGTGEFLKKQGRRGALGLSHTRVPTESRPGHVALLAGLYEDPSAITAGWSENTVEFDHVLNRSSHSWAWGSPDILPMFARGQAGSQGRVSTESYSKQMENFAAENLSSLDTWVFDKVENFFTSAADNETLQLMLRKDGNIFFLHLLGCDTNGHVHKPHSFQYRDNIRTVDEGVERTVAVFEKYFRGDGRTAFLFTADHGMTDWGSHGTGMDVETVTPFLAWGAGIKQLQSNVGAREKFNSWGDFQNNFRIEVNQADLAPLMSTLIGVNIPVNNVGVLPVDILDLHPSHKTEAMLEQINQLLAQYEALKQRHEQVYLPNIFHVAYSQLSEDKVGRKKLEINKVSKMGQSKEAMRLCHKFIEEINSGIEYYQRYQQNILLILIKSSFIGCAVINLAKLCSDGRKSSSVLRRHSTSIYTLFGLLIFIANMSWYCQRLPYHFLLYYLAPVFVWSKLIFYLMTRTFVSLSVTRLNMVVFIEVVAILLIIRESFFERSWLSLGFLTLLIHPVLNSQSLPRTTFPFWLFILSTLGVFPWLPVVDGRMEHQHLVLTAGLLTSTIALYIIFFLRDTESPSKLKVWLSLAPGLSSLCVFFTSLGSGPSSLVQGTAWAIFLLSIPAALTTRPFYLERTPFLCLALISSYILLSLSYEAAFLPILCLAMALWSRMEEDQSQDNYKKHDYFGSFLRQNREKVFKRMVNVKDVSCILSFLFLIFYSFFATGNIASLNSFDPSSIRCFVAIFNPFLMGGLLLIKIIIPFLCVSLFFIQIIWFRACDFGLVMNVLQMFCDILGLMFFNLVKSTGSWLEIGSSLSHFVIVEGTTIFIVVLLYFAAMISKINLVSPK